MTDSNVSIIKPKPFDDPRCVAYVESCKNLFRLCKDCSKTFPLTKDFFCLNSDASKRPTKPSFYFKQKCRKCLAVLRRIQKYGFEAVPQISIRTSRIRKCTGCNSTYPNTRDFFETANNKNDGILKSRCIDCVKEERKQRRKRRNPDIRSMQVIEAARNAPTKRCAGCSIIFPNTNEFFKSSIRRNGHSHPSALDSECRQCARIRMNTIRKRRLAADPALRLTEVVRRQLLHVINEQGSTKRASTFTLLGYKSHELVAHLQNQFCPDMTLDNHGRGLGKWHIDHIRPLASYKLNDYSTLDDLIRDAFALNNLQPMWGHENHAKSSVWNGARWHKGKPLTLKPSNLKCNHESNNHERHEHHSCFAETAHCGTA